MKHKSCITLIFISIALSWTSHLLVGASANHSTQSDFTVVGSFTMDGDHDFRQQWRLNELVEIVRPADVLYLTFAIYSENKDPSVRISDLDSAFQKIGDAIESRNEFQLKIENLDLSLAGWQGIRFLRKVRDNERSSFTVNISMMISPGASIFQQMQTLADFVANIQLPDGVGAAFLNTGLGIRNPESYRAELFNKFKQALETTRSALGEEVSYHIKGIGEPVRTSNVDGRNIAIYLPLSCELTESK